MALAGVVVRLIRTNFRGKKEYSAPVTGSTQVPEFTLQYAKKMIWHSNEISLCKHYSNDWHKLINEWWLTKEISRLFTNRVSVVLALQPRTYLTGWCVSPPHWRRVNKFNIYNDDLSDHHMEEGTHGLTVFRVADPTDELSELRPPTTPVHFMEWMQCGFQWIPAWWCQCSGGCSGRCAHTRLENLPTQNARS